VSELVSVCVCVLGEQIDRAIAKRKRYIQVNPGMVVGPGSTNPMTTRTTQTDRQTEGGASASVLKIGS